MEKIKLFEFQKANISKGIRFLKNGGKGIYIADECGLGKTIQALYLAQIATKIKRNGVGVGSPKGCIKKTLVVCPKGLIYTWQAECERLGLESKSIDRHRESQVFDSTADVIIISYPFLLNAKCEKRISEIQKNFGFGVIIVDEAHYIKNHKSSRTKILFKRIIPIINPVFTIFLSATPQTNSIVDLFVPCSYLAPDITSFRNYWDFARRYTNLTRTRFGVQLIGARNIPELSQIIRSRFFVRNKKKDVLKDLPDKIQKTLPYFSMEMFA